MIPIHRRNFLPTFIINLFLWLGFLLIIFKLPPDKFVSVSLISYHLLFSLNIFLFFIVLTLALTLTLALILGNTRRGFLLTIFLDGFLLLRLLKLTSWLSMVFLFLILLVLEIYLSRRKTNL